MVRTVICPEGLTCQMEHCRHAIPHREDVGSPGDFLSNIGCDGSCLVAGCRSLTELEEDLTYQVERCQLEGYRA